jgi:hypothetical protein
MPEPPPPDELIVYTPADSLTVTFVPAVIPTTGSVTVFAAWLSFDSDARKVCPERLNVSMVCISFVVEPSTSVPVTVIVLPAVDALLMPPPAMVTEPPELDKVAVLEATDNVCSSLVAL